MKFSDLQNVLAHEFGSDTAAKVGNTIRRHAGGECVYIPAREPPPIVSPFDTPRDLMRRGVARRTAYAMIKRSSK